MGNELIIQERTQVMSASDVRQHVNLIQQVMQSIMKADTHYGVIPGTQKPSLYKAGSEVLLTTFRIAVDPQVEDLSTADEIRYRVTCRGVHQGTNVVVGAGIGECSTNEDKYKWRKAVCDEEFNETPENRRRVKYARGKGNTHYTMKQIRTEPSDLANTVLKMAKKRAQIDLTLTATGASDIFTQDIEDLPPEYLDRGGPARGSPNAGAGDSLTPEEREKMKALAEKVLAWFKDGSIGDAFAELDNAALETDHKLYIWTFFDSKQRAALKKEGERVKAANVAQPQATPAAKLISDAQRKRLEARINELKLPRDEVKAQMRELCGKEHFQDLTTEEYQELDISLDSMTPTPTEPEAL